MFPQSSNRESSAVIDLVSFGSGPVLGRLGKYDLVARLGQGGMAGVYLAVARGGLQDFRKLVVLKVLHENLRSNEKFVDMFVREAKIAADLAHNNVVHTYDVEEEGGHYYLVMEYLDGVPLSSLLKATRDWPLRDRMPLLGALCLALGGLHYVHEFHDFQGNHLGLVHRDFKPANIFITFDGSVKVLDFGVAKMTAPEIEETAGQAIKGTVQYMAPEALDSRVKVDRRMDVFSAGLIAWEIAMGDRVWGDRDHLQILRCLASGEFPDMDERSVELPDDLYAMCRQAMWYRPSGRQDTAREFKQQLQNFLISQDFRIDAEELGAMVRSQFGDLREKRTTAIREQLQILATQDEQASTTFVAEELPMDNTPSTTDARQANGTTSRTDVDVVAPGVVLAAEPRGDGRNRLLFAVIALLSVAVVVLFAMRSSDGEPRPQPPAVAAAAPATTPAAVVPAPAPPEAAPSAPAAAAVAGTPAAPPPTLMPIRVEPAGATVSVDGVVLTGNPPMLSGAANQAHEITVTAPGFHDKTLQATLDGRDGLDVALVPVSAEQPPAPRPRRRRWGTATPATDTSQAESPAVPPTPSAAPKPGDDIAVNKQRAGSQIDTEISWDK